MNIFDLDIAILRWIIVPLSPSIEFLLSATIYSIYLCILFLAYFLFKKREKNKLFQLIITSFIGIVFVYFLKYLIARPRPYELYSDIHNVLVKADPSFPSSHAFISFLCLSFLPKKLSKTAKFLFYVYLVILIPLSILCAGVHFPSDIIAGAIIGLSIPKIIPERATNRLTKKIFK